MFLLTMITSGQHPKSSFTYPFQDVVLQDVVAAMINYHAPGGLNDKNRCANSGHPDLVLWRTLLSAPYWQLHIRKVSSLASYKRTNPIDEGPSFITLFSQGLHLQTTWNGNQGFNNWVKGHTSTQDTRVILLTTHFYRTSHTNNFSAIPF